MGQAGVLSQGPALLPPAWPENAGREVEEGPSRPAAQKGSLRRRRTEGAPENPGVPPVWWVSSLHENKTERNKTKCG